MSASPVRNAEPRDLAVLDPVWSRLRAEAEDLLHTEPQLASFIVATVLNHTSLAGAVSHRVASRLGHPSLPAELIAHAFHEAIAAVDLAGGLARAEPALAPEILWGARALMVVEDRWARSLLGAWDAGRSSLRVPLLAAA